MKTPGQDLIQEHKAIRIALNVIEQMAKQVQHNKEVEAEDIEKMIAFLKVFADQCHHGKEEDYLFPALEEAGVKNQDGPIGIMLEQHRQGREYIRQMQESISNRTINKNAFAAAASSYVALLRDHIIKEDTYLFPMSDAKLNASKQQELMSNFEILEKNVIGEGRHEELHALLLKMKDKYL